MKTIGIEEHWATPSFYAQPGAPGWNYRQALTKISENFAKEQIDDVCDLGAKRIANMDANGLDMQILTLTTPGAEQMDAADAIPFAHEMNDYIAEVIKKNPTRFKAFATVPTSAPDKAVEELERCMKQDCFVGLGINGNNQGRYLDNPMYWPLLETAEKLEAPIFIHPVVPNKTIIDAYYDVGDPVRTAAFSGGAFGWHIETAIHALRLVYSGTFDRFPKLQVVIGHMGEGIPFFVNRMDEVRGLVTKTVSKGTVKLPGLERTIPEYLRQNMHYLATSGFSYMSTFLLLLLEIGADRIMFSTDHPYSEIKDACKFLDNIPVSDKDRESIAHGNAEKLFKL